ncbi:DUF4932 domain-containing protein [Spirochaeta lutea]|uniref:DUF4932 domain-containing protein n=1 Tax=Spirochaeta lutea TaxID=1480694 RepID=A0A098QW72_9SPIO|nr:DUF4932 domain-containing protein [Spirochaeta lutea]KGE72110.1 hypothetical protein DC28_07780 [Spirochaeta lutea]
MTELKEYKNEIFLGNPQILYSDKKYKIFVDPKIELTYLILEIMRYKTGFSQYRISDYMQKQIASFSSYIDHPVFETLLGMFRRGFSYDAIPGILHRINGDGSLKENLIRNEYYIRRAGGEKIIENFVIQLHDFNKDINYLEYFYKNSSFYKEQGNKTLSNIRKIDIITTLNAFFGETAGKINICLTPDATHGYGVTVDYDNQTEMYPTLGNIDDPLQYLSFLIHELSHPFVNPLIYKENEMVSITESLYKPIEQKMRRQVYPNWEITLIEHIVRAITIKIMCITFPSNNEKEMIEKEINKGFIYIETIIGSLDYYLNHRNEYKIFRTYFNKLLEDVTDLI